MTQKLLQRRKKTGLVHLKFYRLKAQVNMKVSLRLWLYLSDCGVSYCGCLCVSVRLWLGVINCSYVSQIVLVCI